LDFWIALFIAILTFAIFSPALRNEFVGWDDYDLLVDNLHYRGLGWEQLRWMFSTFHQGHYQPLSWMTLGLDYLIWGMNPFGYHLTNLLLHAANAALFFLLALRLLSLTEVSPSRSAQFGLRAAAGFAALFFSIHPLRVESVAWATERRDVLAGFFFLATILCYLRVASSSKNASDRRRWLIVATVFYALSLLSKASGVALPIVLLVLDIYPLRRLGGRAGKWFGRSARWVWFEKIPFLAISIPAAIVAPLAQADAGAVASLRAHSIADRLAQSVYGLAFYVWKTVLPLDLSPFYEVPRHLIYFVWPVLLSSAAVATITFGALALRSRWPAALAAWIYYMVILSPVLGIVQSGRQLVADRYSYLSCLAWAVLAGAGLYSWWQPSADQLAKSWPRSVLAPSIIWIVALGVLTIRQVQVWHDTNALWKQVIAVTDNSTFRSATAHHLAAQYLADRGDLDAAIAHLRTSIEIEPNDFTTYSDLGVTLVKFGRLDEAIESFRHAITLNPKLSLLHFQLGNALALQGRLDEAAQHLQDALRIDPNYPQVYNNLGKIMAAQGQLDRAIDLFRRAVKIQPDFIEARHNLAMALDETGRKEEATLELQEAARIKSPAPQAAIR
jgi:protein O-mannosyl-transferase